MSSFVSRGGEKLDYALTNFKVNPQDLICADFGSSTGGFVDCLIQHGAKKVYSVDTAYGELDWNLRNNDKVVVLERTNALHVNLPEKVDLITIDAGWTRQELIIPSALKNLKPEGKIISLLKPHYEASREQLEKGKVKEEFHEQIISDVTAKLIPLGIIIQDIIESPIEGKRRGNKEFFILIINSNEN
ncbi:TlyA family rRNA (cytidine-2'-O)-methyltransferase [Candidatus Dojkabacteria bacterium]|uniref:TlyA family rRNA (Cytidine-2'-O)-methyltransferase n=1 Tax=Candidatus Dojkabacteria bacterium TaxID=2099670 RepID=A0A955L2R3_9BACT|nr:TlyA family rRNA (cytidine-2'-O)-methyltransferase [Candidatus Dojkabacteria bacterium]